MTNYPELEALLARATPGPLEVLLPAEGERAGTFGRIQIRSDNDSELVASF